MQNGDNLCEILKTCLNYPTLCPHSSGTKCDRHKLILSAERGGKSSCTIQYGIRSTFTKTGVITAEPSYHV